MTRSNTGIGTFAVCALLSAGCDSAGSTGTEMLLKPDNAPVHQASGGGTVDVPAGRSTYAFHASIDGAGSVSGGFEFHFASSGANVHGDVTCLLVIGNYARLTGVVTNSSDEGAMATGTVLHWQALDNGEGSNAPPDRVSSFYGVVNPALCGFVNVLDKDWTNGNVQVK